MAHALIFIAVGLVIGWPVMYIRRRGMPGSKDLFREVTAEAVAHNRVILRPGLAGRFFGAETLIVDRSGIIISGRWTEKSFNWPSIIGSFKLEQDLQFTRLIFLYSKKNPNFGRKRLFNNVLDEYISNRIILDNSYSLGWHDFQTLLNQMRLKNS